MSDLFEFFKENESKLYETPSSQAWSKLEARLERKRRQTRRGIRFLQLGIIVVVVLLLIMIAFLVWQNAKK
jgi:uncharacterized membrane protein YukC